MRIAISPDENPGDPGAVHNGIVERDVNIKVATALQAALQRCGQDAWFDAGITFEERVAKANSDGTQLLVACAHNAAGSPAAEGALFLFCNVNGDGGAAAKAFGHQAVLAEKCGEALVAGGLVGHWTEWPEEVYECCAYNGDTLYCEFGYETNPDDAARIQQPDYPARAAELLCSGIAAALGFPFAPIVHPSAPDPEWKANLQPLPAPITGVLAAAVDVTDTIKNEKVAELAQGSSLTVAFGTRAHKVDYYMTQWSVDHATGYAIEKAKVTFEALGDKPADPGKPLPDPNEGNRPSDPGQQAPGSTPPAQPQGGLVGFEQDAQNWLLGFADRELIQLIEFAINELKKRAA